MLTFVALGENNRRAERTVSYTMRNFPRVEAFGVRDLEGPRLCLENGSVQVQWQVSNVTSTVVGGLLQSGAQAGQGVETVECEAEIILEAIREGSDFFGNPVVYPISDQLPLVRLSLSLNGAIQTEIPYSQINNSPAANGHLVNRVDPQAGVSLRINPAEILSEGSESLNGRVILRRLTENGQVTGPEQIINFAEDLDLTGWVDIPLSDGDSPIGYTLLPRQDYLITLVEIDNHQGQVISQLTPDLSLNFTTTDEGLQLWHRFKETSGTAVLYDWSAQSDSLNIEGPLAFLGTSLQIGAATYLQGHDGDYVGEDGLTIEAMLRVDGPLSETINEYVLPEAYTCEADSNDDGVFEWTDLDCDCTVADPNDIASAVNCSNCNNMGVIQPGDCQLEAGFDLELQEVEQAINAPYLIAKDGEFALGVAPGEDNVARWQLGLGLTTSCGFGLEYLADRSSPSFLTASSQGNIFQSASMVESGSFVHVVGRFEDNGDGENNFLNLFINYSNVNSYEIDSTPGDDSDILSNNCALPLNLNALNNGAIISNGLANTASELTIYNRPLSTGEIEGYCDSARASLGLGDC